MLPFCTARAQCKQRGCRHTLVLDAAKLAAHERLELVQRLPPHHAQLHPVRRVLPPVEAHQLCVHINALRLRLRAQCRRVACEEARKVVVGVGDRLPELLLPPAVGLEVLAVLAVDGVALARDAVRADQRRDEELQRRRLPVESATC